jgi:hypothetical protein
VTANGYCEAAILQPLTLVGKHRHATRISLRQSKSLAAAVTALQAVCRLYVHASLQSGRTSAHAALRAISGRDVAMWRHSACDARLAA